MASKRGAGDDEGSNKRGKISLADSVDVNAIMTTEGRGRI
jgi:hypothetical protein